MLLKQSSFLEGQGAFEESALEVLVLVSMSEADVSFQPPTVEETFAAVCEFTRELFEAFVLEQVAAQVRLPPEATPTSRRRALVQTLAGVDGQVLR